MSTVYQGSAANITRPLGATITNATNASPIVITTSSAHGYQTGDLVFVANVGGNTAANCDAINLWTITVISSTTFSLNGSTGSGAYTSGGICTDFSLTPAGQLPSDGDNEAAATIDAMVETLADRSQYLIQRIGKYRLINQLVVGVSDDTWSTYSSTSLSIGWGALTGLSAMVPPAAPPNPSLSVLAGDMLDIGFTCSGATSGIAPVSIGLGVNIAGAGLALITGSAQQIVTPVATFNASLRGSFTVGGAGVQSVQVGIMGHGGNISPPTLNLQGHYSFIVNHYRPNT